MKKRKMMYWIGGIVLLGLLLPGFNNALKIVPYQLRAEGITQPIRIALVTDLHSCAYGEEQQTLLDALEVQAPDLILLGGDIFDDRLPDDNTIRFLEGISGRYPCCYVTGNHEYRGSSEVYFQRMAILETCGIQRLSGEMAALELRGVRLCICGVDDPDAWTAGADFSIPSDSSFSEQLARAAELPEESSYSILLTHRPERLALYSQYGFDLVLAGHAHGGQWRIPRILNGLLAPNQGLFPKYAGGEYEQNGTVMIVSRGLARESTRVPRIYNRPELVIIELSK